MTDTKSHNSGTWVSTGSIYDLVLEMRTEIVTLKTTVKTLTYIVMPIVSAVTSLLITKVGDKL